MSGAPPPKGSSGPVQRQNHRPSLDGGRSSSHRSAENNETPRFLEGEDLLPERMEYNIKCGRGRGYYNRGANQRARQLLRRRLHLYVMAKGPLERRKVVDALMDEIQRQDGGKARFIKLATSTEGGAEGTRADSKGRWVYLTREQVRDKVGHMLRDIVSIRRRIEGTRTKSREGAGGDAVLPQQKRRQQQEKDDTPVVDPSFLAGRPLAPSFVAAAAEANCLGLANKAPPADVTVAYKWSPTTNSDPRALPGLSIDPDQAQLRKLRLQMLRHQQRQILSQQLAVHETNAGTLAGKATLALADEIAKKQIKMKKWHIAEGAPPERPQDGRDDRLQPTLPQNNQALGSQLHGVNVRQVERSAVMCAVVKDVSSNKCGTAAKSGGAAFAPHAQQQTLEKLRGRVRSPNKQTPPSVVAAASAPASRHRSASQSDASGNYSVAPRTATLSTAIPPVLPAGNMGESHCSQVENQIPLARANGDEQEASLSHLRNGRNPFSEGVAQTFHPAKQNRSAHLRPTVQVPVLASAVKRLEAEQAYKRTLPGGVASVFATKPSKALDMAAGSMGTSSRANLPLDIHPHCEEVPICAAAANKSARHGESSPLVRAACSENTSKQDRPLPPSALTGAEPDCGGRPQLLLEQALRAAAYQQTPVVMTTTTFVMVPQPRSPQPRLPQPDVASAEPKMNSETPKAPRPLRPFNRLEDLSLEELQEFAAQATAAAELRQSQMAAQEQRQRSVGPVESKLPLVPEWNSQSPAELTETEIPRQDQVRHLPVHAEWTPSHVAAAEPAPIREATETIPEVSTSVREMAEVIPELSRSEKACDVRIANGTDHDESREGGVGDDDSEADDNPTHIVSLHPTQVNVGHVESEMHTVAHPDSALEMMHMVAAVPEACASSNNAAAAPLVPSARLECGTTTDTRTSAPSPTAKTTRPHDLDTDLYASSSKRRRLELLQMAMRQRATSTLPGGAQNRAPALEEEHALGHERLRLALRNEDAGDASLGFGAAPSTELTPAGSDTCLTEGVEPSWTTAGSDDLARKLLQSYQRLKQMRDASLSSRTLCPRAALSFASKLQAGSNQRLPQTQQTLPLPALGLEGPTLHSRPPIIKLPPNLETAAGAASNAASPDEPLPENPAMVHVPCWVLVPDDEPLADAQATPDT